MPNLGPVLTRDDIESSLRTLTYGRPAPLPFQFHDDLETAVRDAMENVMEGFPTIAAAQLHLILKRLALGPVPSTLSAEREVA